MPVKYVLVLRSIKKNILTSTQLQYLTFQPNPRGQACVKIQSVTLHFFHFSLICNMTTFRKEKKWPFDPTPGGVGVCNDGIFAFLVLSAPFPLI